MTIADNLQELESVKADIKSAIESKGVTVTGGLSSYANAIYNITSQGDNNDKYIKFPINTRFFSELGTLWEPYIDTSDWTSMWRMFTECNVKTYLPLLDASKVVDIRQIFFSEFGYHGHPFELGGFKNLGMQPDLIGTDNMNFGAISKDSVINIINNLYDRARAGYSILTLKLSCKLTDEDDTDWVEPTIAIATNKGWIVELGVY